MEQQQGQHNPIWRLTLFAAVATLVIGAIAYAYHRRGGDLGAALGSVQQASSDAATTARVKAALALSERVSAFDVRVASRAGAVTLHGVVPSEEVRQLAGNIAGTLAGVHEVTNALPVDPRARPEPVKERMASRVADLEIETAIQEALYRDPAIREGTVQVRVQDGVVELRGGVPGAAERYRAELVARSVPGVGSVDNRLSVPQEEPEDGDHRLALAVEFELYLARAFDLEPLSITASDATVRLSGPVRSRAEKLLAGRIAAEVEGVRQVVDELAVATAPGDGKVPAEGSPRPVRARPRSAQPPPASV
ncbi:MAG: BON domain-containing protein [Thermoanaerobaculia bacterium]|nr:BON domain-containing protein [Thermoanaerobaculia bacterium]